VSLIDCLSHLFYFDSSRIGLLLSLEDLSHPLEWSLEDERERGKIRTSNLHRNVTARSNN